MTAHFVSLGFQSNWWQVLTSPFMRNALIGGTIVALAAGLIGYFIVVRRTAFAAHALAHIGLPGATGAVLLGIPPVLGLGAFCVGGALVIGALGKRADDRDVVTGTILAFATGLGLFFNSLATKSSSTMTNVLFGNLLAISREQLLTFAALLVLLAVSIAAMYRPLLYASINAPVAEAKGLPVRTLSIFFMVLLDRGDDGGPGGRHAAAVRAGHHPRGHRDHADAAAGRGDGDLHGPERGVDLARAGGLGDVQPAAELPGRHARQRHLARGVAP